MQCKHMPLALALVTLSGTAGARAQVDVYIDNVDNSSQLTGCVTRDLKVDTEVDWFGSAIVLELDEGSIYQDGSGSDVGPYSFYYSTYPSVAYDTFMAVGESWPGVLGAGGDAGGHDYQFDTQRLDASWKSNTSIEIGLTRIARITLSDDAAGRWHLAVFQSGEETRYDFSGTIEGGVMTIDP